MNSFTRKSLVPKTITNWIVGLGFVMLAAVPAFAQAATPASKLAFDEVGQTVAVAQSATYNATIDAAAPVALAGVSCTATTTPVGATCTATLPALTLGTHTLTLTQTISGATSPASTPALSFTYVIVVTPTNIRISGDDE